MTKSLTTIEGVQATPTALLISRQMDFGEWEQVGKDLGRINQGLLWWIGDWLNYGERAYGESYAQAMEVTGKAYATVKQAAYIAKKFPPEVRREGVTFSHYGVIAGLPDDIGDRLIKLAEGNQWSVTELKEQRAKVENKEEPKREKDPETIICPHCNKEFLLSEAGSL